VPEKKKIMAPPVQYDLLRATPQQVCMHIDELTKGANLESPGYVANLKQMMYENHQTRPIIFGYIPAPPIEVITKQVIGVGGYFFKMTTTVCGVYFIWHDTDTNMFLFWGPSQFKVVKAMNSIRWRIFKHCEMWGAGAASEAANAEDEDEYADMPGLISQGSSPDYEHPEQC